MSLQFTSINSGSNGNCYYVGNDNEAVLIDAGISCGQILKRMKAIGLDIKKVKAIFVSHEHTDHVKGLYMLSKKHRLPVYITPVTAQNLRVRPPQDFIVSYNIQEKIKVGTLTVSAFPKYHDASDPISFMISEDDVNIGVFTDIGKPCENLVNHFRQCNAAFLEANYDEEMLENGSYPYFLKKRIRGGLGHISNRQALELFLNHKPKHMSHLLLSHLSKYNNCPVLAGNLFKSVAGSTEVIVASREEAMPVYRINGSQSSATAATQMMIEFPDCSTHLNAQ